MESKNSIKLFLLLLFLLSIHACKTRQFRSNYTDGNSLIQSTENVTEKPFLKAHLKNGDVCILSDKWEVDTLENVLFGYGERYNYNRKKIYEGALLIHFDSVAIFETNIKIKRPEANRIIALSVMAGVDIAIGVFCFINPKACFGSCPTFYINEHDNFRYADAEGFSSAILPSLEYYDIDAINKHSIQDGVFSLTMKNEALETHCVRNVKLLAYPVKENERVYHSPTNDFYLCKNEYELTGAFGEEGEITDLLKKKDRIERFSLSDEKNLRSKEEIYLTYNNVQNANNLGLLLNFRQSLMSTYFIYSAMGYMGDEVGRVFAKIENNPKVWKDFENRFFKRLGGIDVYVWDKNKNKWIFQDVFNETGPIAINRQIIPLENVTLDSTVKIKLVLNKGLWRIDYASLTNIEKQIDPIEVNPSSVYNKGVQDNEALHEILSDDKYLISMPGSEYKFNFELSEPNQEYELFLYSKGYYIEWMREQWLKDKDIKKLGEMVYLPKKYFKSEAKNYKEYETTMEDLFWDSKIDTKNFSYYED